MPYYERTGMISHRHPFYGTGFFAEDPSFPGMATPGSEGINAAVAAGLQAAGQTATGLPESGSEADMQANIDAERERAIAEAKAASGSMMIPLLLAGGVALIFLFTLKGGKKR